MQVPQRSNRAIALRSLTLSAIGAASIIGGPARANAGRSQSEPVQEQPSRTDGRTEVGLGYGDLTDVADRLTEARSTELASPFQAEIEMRESFGLAADKSYVASLHARSDFDRISAEFGLPLLPAEKVAVRAQMDLQSKLTVAQKELASRFGSSFAGAAIDQRRGGIIEIYRTPSSTFGNDRDAVAEVRNVLGVQGARVEIYTVSYDLQTLTGAYGAVLDSLSRIGDQRSSVGFDVRRNVVSVLLDPADAAQTEAGLRAQLGALVDGPIELRTSSEIAGITTGRDDEDPPMRGGMQIDAGPVCTAGAPRVKLAFDDGHSELRTLTAGHCIPSLGTDVHWRPPFSTAWGRTTSEVFHDDSMADAGLIAYYSIYPNNIPGCNKVYKESGDLCFGSVTSNNPAVGTVLVGSNGVSGVMPGEVVNSAWTGTQCNANGTNCARIVGQIKVAPLTQPGDSGSPWYVPSDKPKFVGVATAIYVQLSPQGIVPLGTAITTWPKIVAQYEEDGYNATPVWT